MNMASLRGKVLASLLLGLVVVLALGLYADLAELLSVLRGFEFGYVPSIIGLTLINYALRFLKWQWYLRVIGITGLSVRRSALIFLSGFSMVMTPGKVGEYLKCYWVRQATGTPLSVLLPVVFAERVNDGLAMFVLAASGIVAYGYGWGTLVGIVVAVVVALGLAQNERLAHRIFAILRQVRFVANRVSHLETVYDSARRLFAWRTLAWAVPIGVVSWGAEGIAFYLVLRGLGIDGGWNLAVESTSIFALSSIIGALSMLPGGLAVAEGSITGLLQATGVVGNAPTAAAATLLIRFATLWFGVLVGVLVLFPAIGRLSRAEFLAAAEPVSDRAALGGDRV